MCFKLAHRFVFILTILVLSSLGFGQYQPSGYLIVENFFWSRPSFTGGHNRLSWANGEYGFAPNLKVVGSYLDIPGNGTVFRLLDEGYVEYRHEDKIVRAGRMRARFGLGDWAELFYTPIAQWPMIRANPVNSLGLLRFDTGVDVQGGSPDLQYQVGILDVHSSKWQLVPQSADHATARIQASKGDFIIGVNGLSKTSDSAVNDTMGGVDVRWTSDHMIVRAEYDRGFDHGTNAEGSYFDFFYRPQALFRTQFGVRQEFYRVIGGAQAEATTVGFRHILSENFAATLNYTQGNNVAPASNMKGWTLQLMTAKRF